MGSRRGGVGQSEEGDRTHAARLRRVPPCGVASLSPRPQDPPRSRCEAGRRGAETMGRGAGGTAPLRAAGTPRGGASGRGGHQPAALGTASAHLDEELDEGLFVLLLQSVQGHRQRHGQLGWAPRTAAAAVAPGLLWLRVPAAGSLAGSLAHWTVRASSCPWLRSSAPPHASRATLRGLRSLALQTAGRSPVGVAWAEQWPSAIGSCGGREMGRPEPEGVTSREDGRGAL